MLADAALALLPMAVVVAVHPPAAVVVALLLLVAADAVLQRLDAVAVQLLQRPLFAVAFGFQTLLPNKFL